MSLQWPAPDYATVGLDLAQACSLPEFFAISPATTSEYAFRQDFMQLRASFVPTPLDTAHPSTGMTPDFSTYFLVKEDDRKDMGNGLAKWTRTYAKVPASYDDFESFAYHFIGYGGVVVTGSAYYVSVTGRQRFTRIVASRVANAFFQTATPQTDIAPILGQRYLTGGTDFPGIEVDYLWDSQTVAGQTYAGTVPSATEYQALVAAGTEIVAEDSRIERMFGSGNLWVRKTRYVVAY
jgi:hypothetical protein